jgi:hypothetical protein
VGKTIWPDAMGKLAEGSASTAGAMAAAEAARAAQQKSAKSGSFLFPASSKRLIISMHFCGFGRAWAPVAGHPSSILRVALGAPALPAGPCSFGGG